MIHVPGESEKPEMIVKKPSRRPSYVLVGVALLIVVVAIFLVMDTAPSRENTGTKSTGDPDSLSYGIPVKEAENVVVSGKEVVSLTCITEGEVVCVEPVLDVLFADNENTGNSRWEQWGYLRLENRRGDDVVVTNLELSADGRCYLDPGGFTIKSLQMSDTLTLLCIGAEDASEFDGAIIVSYTVQDVLHKSTIYLKT